MPLLWRPLPAGRNKNQAGKKSEDAGRAAEKRSYRERSGTKFTGPGYSIDKKQGTESNGPVEKV